MATGENIRLEVGVVYLQQQPGRLGLVRFLGEESGSLAFLDLRTGESSHYPFGSWAEIIRKVSVHEVVRARRVGNLACLLVGEDQS